jgi:hypothetical protein
VRRVPDEPEWQPLDPTSFRQRIPIALAVASPFWVLLIGWSLQVALVLFEDFPFVLRILILLAAAFGIGSAALVVAAWLHPAPNVNFGRGVIRVRRRELAFADIDTATVALAAARGGAPLQLAFGRQKGLMARVILRSAKGQRLAKEYVDPWRGCSGSRRLRFRLIRTTPSTSLRGTTFPVPSTRIRLFSWSITSRPRTRRSPSRRACDPLTGSLVRRPVAARPCRGST